MISSNKENQKKNKQVRKSIRADNQKYSENPATTAEKSAREGKLRQLDDKSTKLSEIRSKPEKPIKDKEGQIITEIQEQRNRSVEHFEELLNRPAPLNLPNIEAVPANHPIPVIPPTVEETKITTR
ncbi:unnamed protein product [Schistosoma curassoni]|uniref:Uncharacterized protein n=1 Tax=Schistosoma curassoni TaxID=6186 RepID=A0A183KVH7_9TREM|nr:unnamed protein product [Schistosoma curassoni]